MNKYFYSANNTTFSITPSFKFKVSKNFNFNLAYCLSTVGFSQINSNDSSLKKGLYKAFANKNSVYGDLIFGSDFGFNSIKGIKFHWQLGFSKLFTKFTYETVPFTFETSADQYEYNNLLFALGITADLKTLFQK